MALSIRGFVARLALNGSAAPPHAVDFGIGGDASEWVSWSAGPLTVWARPRALTTDRAEAGALPTLLLGDPAEWDTDRPLRNLVNAVPITFDLASSNLSLFTSIVGLPPVFVHRSANAVVVSSDLFLLAALPGVSLELDPTSVKELGETGHPVDQRTLFKNTRLLESGGRFVLNADGHEQLTETWQLPDVNAVSWREFIDSQVAAFTESTRRIDVSSSVLSLTAGLDTRAVFATLAQQHRLVPAVTMSGPRPSLDARTSAELCRAYGVPHHLVTFDERFSRRLPEFVEQASILSGGLESLEQAPEIFMYDQLPGPFGARLSGNLGNQIGRGGTEGVGVRGADIQILSSGLRAGAVATGDEHWLLASLRDGESSALQFILRREIPFSSVGNFSVGNHFAMQQTPYANRELVETLPKKPAGTHAPSASMIRMRLRDLRHRFLGEPARVSFQRTLLRDLGGFAADYPINLGWRARGGASVPGLAMGVATILGMVVQKAGLDEGAGGSLIKRTGVASLHNFRASARWLRVDLKEFARDTLSSRGIRDTGVFDHAVLDPIIDAHFSGAGNHHETVSYALDVALAHRHFCSRGSK